MTKASELLEASFPWMRSVTMASLTNLMRGWLAAALVMWVVIAFPVQSAWWMIRGAAWDASKEREI